MRYSFLCAERKTFAFELPARAPGMQQEHDLLSTIYQSARKLSGVHVPRHDFNLSLSLHDRGCPNHAVGDPLATYSVALSALCSQTLNCRCIPKPPIIVP